MKLFSRHIVLKFISGKEQSFPNSIIEIYPIDGYFSITGIKKFHKEEEKIIYKDNDIILKEITTGLWKLNNTL